MQNMLSSLGNSIFQQAQPEQQQQPEAPLQPQPQPQPQQLPMHVPPRQLQAHQQPMQVPPRQLQSHQQPMQVPPRQLQAHQQQPARGGYAQQVVTPLVQQVVTPYAQQVVTPLVQQVVTPCAQQAVTPARHNPFPIPYMTVLASNNFNDSVLASNDFHDDDPLRAVALGAAAAGLPEPEPDASQEGPLSVNVRVEYSSLVKGQSRSIFGLVTVKASDVAAAAAQVERQPMDLVCVLDVSGSMQGAKIEELKNAVRFIIGEAGPQDRLSIVTFNSEAKRKLRLATMNEAGKDEAQRATLRLQADGGTTIAAGLHMALEVMEQRRQRNKVAAILLLTDGQDGSAKAALPALLRRAAAAGCSVYGFGFGVDHDSTMMREIGEQARTPFTFVESADQVRDAFAGVFGGLSSIVAQSVELEINFRVGLTEVHTPFEVRRSPTPAGESIVVLIPDMFAGERRDVPVELSVPAELQGDADGRAVLLEASVRYRDLRRSDLLVRTAPLPLTVACSDEQQPEMEPDAEVADQRSRVQVARVLQQAAETSDKGDFESARRLLQEQRSKIRHSSAVAQALQEELADADHRMSDAREWQTSGRAEVQDAMQMHRMQRATNISDSRSATAQKSSKQMYCSPAAQAVITKSRG